MAWRGVRALRRVLILRFRVAWCARAERRHRQELRARTRGKEARGTLVRRRRRRLRCADAWRGVRVLIRRRQRELR